MKFKVIRFFDDYFDGEIGRFETKEEAIAKRNEMRDKEKRPNVSYEYYTVQTL